MAEDPWEPSDAFGDASERSGGFFGCATLLGGVFMIALGGTCAWMGISGRSIALGLIGLGMIAVGWFTINARA